MGTPIPEDGNLFEPGIDCNACEPTLWANGMTPKFVKVVFRDIVKCDVNYPDPPNDVLFHLQQNAGDPCLWEWRGLWHGLDIEITWEHNDPLNLTNLSLYDYTTGGYWFVYWDAPKCQPPNGESLPNQLTCPDPSSPLGEAGSVKVFWSPDNVPGALTHDYGFHPTDTNLSDQIFHPDGDRTVRIADPTDKTNILFHVTPSEMPP